MTHREMLERMGADEMKLWLAKERIEPLGWRRVEHAIANLTAMVAAAFGDKSASFTKFLIYEPAPVQTAAEQQAIMRRAGGG